MKLTKAVDAVASQNFEIPGVTVVSANLDAADKSIVLLNIDGAQGGQRYTLKATGLKISGEVQDDFTFEFEMDELGELIEYTLRTTDGKTQLKADGASSTLIHFELLDKNGNIVTTAGDVEVEFSTTFGKFAERRVTVQNGVATNMLNSEFLTVSRIAQIEAVVKEAADESLIGKKASMQIEMTPNPDEGNEENVGASMTDAEANQADRVVVYFNKNVNVSDYVDANGVVDSKKADIVVEKNATKLGEGTEVKVRGLLPVSSNPKALQILLDVETDPNNALTDNSDVFVKFVDKNGSVDVAREATFKLTDARKPSMLNVTPEGLKSITVRFSESVDLTATDPNNWTIDGTLLSNAKWGSNAKPATIDLGKFDPAKGEDKRHYVTITLGKDADGKQIYFGAGKHSVQAANVGDWATGTDSNNRMNTQTLDFNISVDDTAPAAKVTVQSPEQFLIDYNVSTDVDETKFADYVKLQVQDAASAEGWTDVTDPGITITKPEDDKYLVELDNDWTQALTTSTSKKNYFNFTYRLVVDKEAVINPGNGIKSAEQIFVLKSGSANVENGRIMEIADTKSPEINDIVEVTKGTVFKALMSEPVKIVDASEHETLSEKQDPANGGKGLPTPTAEFIAADGSVTIQATVVGYADAYDTELEIKPDYELPGGEWTLVLRSISDDIGNTAATLTKDFTVEGAAPTDPGFKVDWAFADVDDDFVVEPIDADDTDKKYDYIVIKFTDSIAITGDFKNALKTSNYTLNGEELPSGTQIFADIVGIDEDNVTDSITIRMPNGTLDGKNAPHVINISGFIENKDGDRLANPGEKTLPYQVGNVPPNKDAEDAAAAKPVIDAIADLDNTAATFADDVVKAREAYDALTADQKALVTNYADLQDAEAEVQAAADLAAAIDAANTAKTNAEEAQDAYEAAGGLNTDQEYVDVANAITALDAALAANPQVTADIEDATDALEAATDALVAATTAP